MARSGKSGLAALLVCGLVASGCNGTIHRKTVLGQDTILAVDARQRLVVEGIHPVSGQRVYCAEPSPDAIVAQAASLAAALDTPVAPGSGSGLKSALASGVAESAASIGLRTQSIQLMRDGYYRICEALVNGQIGPDEYRDIVANIDGFMLTMLAIEQLGDKAFASTNVAIGASVNSSANAAGQAGAGGVPLAGADGKPIAGVFGNPSEAAITITGQTGEIALHKSRAIVDVIALYFKQKGEINKARIEYEYTKPVPDHYLNARYREEYFRSQKRQSPYVIRSEY